MVSLLVCLITTLRNHNTETTFDEFFTKEELDKDRKHFLVFGISVSFIPVLNSIFAFIVIWVNIAS